MPVEATAVSPGYTARPLTSTASITFEEKRKRRQGGTVSDEGLKKNAAPSKKKRKMGFG